MRIVQKGASQAAQTPRIPALENWGETQGNGEDSRTSPARATANAEIRLQLSMFTPQVTA